jgi:hypothetical protein
VVVRENVGMPASASRALLALVVAATLAGGVSGCATETAASPTKSPSASAPSATPTPEPTKTAEPPVDSTPITIDCNTLVTPQAMYEINPNLALSESFVPEKGSDAADKAAADGLVCGWVNQTSGETIEVSVASYGDDTLTGLKNGFVTSSTSVPTYGKPPVEGYFQLDGDVGEAQVFSGPYWLTAVSTAFFEPGDASPVVQAALAGLGA